jgi:hypothetical protein
VEAAWKLTRSLKMGEKQEFQGIPTGLATSLVEHYFVRIILVEWKLPRN